MSGGAVRWEEHTMILFYGLAVASGLVFSVVILFLLDSGFWAIFCGSLVGMYLSFMISATWIYFKVPEIPCDHTLEDLN